MFICGLCEKQSASGESAARVVMETRSKEYVNGTTTTSMGWEIVKEVIAHESCAAVRKPTNHAPEAPSGMFSATLADLGLSDG